MLEKTTFFSRSPSSSVSLFLQQKIYHYWDSCEVEKNILDFNRQLYLYTSNFVSNLLNVLLWIQDDLFYTSEELVLVMDELVAIQLLVFWTRAVV